MAIASRAPLAIFFLRLCAKSSLQSGRYLDILIPRKQELPVESLLERSSPMSSPGSQVTAKAKSKPKKSRKKATAITENDVANALKIRVPKINYTPIEKQQRVPGDLNWKGECDCAANLSFSTPKNFLDWIKSDQFSPFWEEYVQNRNDIPGIKNAKPTKYFEQLDNIFKNEAANTLTDDEQCIIQGRPQADWEPYKYALSSIARVYVASRDHLDHEFDAGPFPYDLKFERWYRIWNVFSWCSHDKPLSNLENITRRQNHFKTLTKPWYITKQAMEVNENGGTQEEDSEDQDIESNYEMLWENASSKPASSLGSMTPLASKIPSLPLPPFYEFLDIKEFKNFVTDKFNLFEQKLKIKTIELELTNEDPRLRRRLGSCWGRLADYETERLAMVFYLNTEPLEGPIDMATAPVKIVPIALRNEYEVDKDGIYSSKKPAFQDDDASHLYDAAVEKDALPGSFPGKSGLERPTDLTNFHLPQQNDEQGGSGPSRSLLAEAAAKLSTSRLDSKATLQNEAQELMQYDGRPADDTPKRDRDRSEPTRDEEGLDAKKIKIDRPREESTLQVIDRPQAAPLSSLILSMGSDRSGPRRKSTRISTRPPAPSNSVHTPLWDDTIWRNDLLSDDDEGVDSDIEDEASPIDEEVTGQDENPVTRADDSDHTLTSAEFSSDSHETKSSSCLSESDDGRDRSSEEEEEEEVLVDVLDELLEPIGPNGPENDPDFEMEIDIDETAHEAPSEHATEAPASAVEVPEPLVEPRRTGDEIDRDDPVDVTQVSTAEAVAEEIEDEEKQMYSGEDYAAQVGSSASPKNARKLLNHARLEAMLKELQLPAVEESPLLKTEEGRRKMQRMMTAKLQLNGDQPVDDLVKTPSDEILNLSSVIANMRMTDKPFKTDAEADIWKKYWGIKRATGSIDPDNIGPNLTLSREVLGICQEGGRVPGMDGVIPRPAQITGAAWLHAKENGGILTSADGSFTYKTAFTKGGLDADTPGAGKTTTVIMHIVNSLNKMDELFRRCGEAPAYKPTAVIVPPISIDQWIKDFRNNAPTVNLLIYWGSKGDKKDSWWREHHISSKDFADGPEKVPERLKYIFDTTDRRAASTVILTTHQTMERRTKYTAQIQGSDEKLPSFHGRFIRGIIDEAHAIKDPESNLFKALYLMGFEYRHLLTATPMINSHQDIIGIAGFLHRQEFEDQAHVADTFNIWEEDVAPEDPRALLALSRQRIANRFRSIDWGDLDSTEFANLRATMRKILLPIQLRRANGTVLKEADGREVIMGNDIPPYVVHTIDLYMEPDGVKEYNVISESISKEFLQRMQQWAQQKSKKEEGFPYPSDLQRILEMSSSSPMLKRFMDSLPQNSTLVKALALMRKCKIDYRFFVEKTLRPGDSKPKDKLGYLRHMVRNSPKSRKLLQILRKHVVEGNDSCVLIFCNQPVTAMFLLWLLEAMHYNVKWMDSHTSKQDKQKMIIEFNDPTSGMEVLLTTYRIGSQALNLQTCCSCVVLYEPATNTNIEIQALGRVRRPGQKKPQILYRLFVEDTFNSYQEMKQLEKRMGDIAGWGGKDMEEAIRQLLLLEEKDILNDDSRLAGVKRLNMHIKGQARDRGIQPVHTPFHQTTVMREY